MRKTGGKPRCGGKIEATRVRMVWLRLQTLSVVELGIMEKSPSWKPTWFSVSFCCPMWCWVNFLCLLLSFLPPLSQKTSQIMGCIPGSPRPLLTASTSLWETLCAELGKTLSSSCLSMTPTSKPSSGGCGQYGPTSLLEGGWRWHNTERLFFPSLLVERFPPEATLSLTENITYLIFGGGSITTSCSPEWAYDYRVL